MSASDHAAALVLVAELRARVAELEQRWETRTSSIKVVAAIKSAREASLEARARELEASCRSLAQIIEAGDASVKEAWFQANRARARAAELEAERAAAMEVAKP